MTRYGDLSSGDIRRLIELGKRGVGRKPEYWLEYAKLNHIDMELNTPPTGATLGVFIIPEGERKGQRGSLEQLYLYDPKEPIKKEYSLDKEKVKFGEVEVAEGAKRLVLAPLLMVVVFVVVLWYFLVRNIRKG